MARVVILGAGPAGLGAAVGLARKGHEVIVIEQADRVGGNAGSFELAGVQVDYGSHRFHPAADPEVFALVQELLGDDLLERPRHGRIRLLGRWIHFPLRLPDLVRNAHPRFTGGVMLDVGRRVLPFSAGSAHADTFASVLQKGLGTTICREFYFPYARKIWGLEPEDISPTQAYKRVSAGSISKLLKRVLRSNRTNDRAKRKDIFYYPRKGYGQICDALMTAAKAAGADVRLRSSVQRLELAPSGHRTEIESATGREVLVSDRVWATIPMKTLVERVSPSAPPAVVAAAARLQLRAMLLVYLVLDTDQFTEFDAHYFPEEGLPFTRVSEPKNYAASGEPKGVTVLCAEIPCNRNDVIWSRPDNELGELVRDGLARAGLPVRCHVLEVAVRRLPAAYPIYLRGYETAFEQVDGWLNSLDGLLVFGRQGLYAHDNTHHALSMAQAAVDCMRGEAFDGDAWQRYRKQFASHVVED